MATWVETAGAALVTGASRGIGRAVAVDLARRGFDVVAAMRDPHDGVALTDELGDGGGSISVARMDVTDASTIDIPDDLRVLVNNAGVDSAYLPVEHAPLEAWRESFETNVFGLIEVTRRAVPVLRQNGGGVICNVTSSSLMVPVPFYAVYRASKAAVSVVGESLAVELAPFGIRVLEIMPGPIGTDMLAASDRLPEGAGHAGYEQLAQEMLEGRRSVQSMVTSAQAAAAAIGDAIVDDGARGRRACDPLGQILLDAWRTDPGQFFPAAGPNRDRSRGSGPN